GALLRLGHLLGEHAYIDAAQRTLIAARESLQRAPHAHPSLLAALRRWHQPETVILLRGERALMEEWRDALDAHADIKQVVFAIPAAEKHLPEALAARAPRGACVAYVCRGFTCSPPL